MTWASVRTPKHIEDRVLKLYAKGLYRWQIAGRTGVSEPTVSKIVHRRGAPKRRSGWKRKFTTDEAVALVSELGSFSEAARRLGVSPEAVCRRLRGRSIPGRAELDKRSHYGIRYSDEERERALSMYADDSITMDEIVAKIGCNKSTLREWVRDAGMSTRPEGQPRKFDLDEARELYAKYQSYRDVAFILDVSESSIGRALRGDAR